jgi:hypothetical protein
VWAGNIFVDLPNLKISLLLRRHYIMLKNHVQVRSITKLIKDIHEVHDCVSDGGVCAALSLLSGVFVL